MQIIEQSCQLFAVVATAIFKEQIKIYRSRFMTILLIIKFTSTQRLESLENK